jgi:hypothetical protein
MIASRPTLQSPATKPVSAIKKTIGLAPSSKNFTNREEIFMVGNGAVCRS